MTHTSAPSDIIATDRYAMSASPNTAAGPSVALYVKDKRTDRFVLVFVTPVDARALAAELNTAADEAEERLAL